MSDWYARQFGDRDHFAIGVSLGRDPHPLLASTSEQWGGLSIWVRGRCLTRSVTDDSAVSDEVRWTLHGLLEWFARVAVRMVNEEPFPLASRRDQVRDACEWFNETESPMVTLTEAEEGSWFQQRSDWRNHHALRRAVIDAALPNVAIRRLGDFLEISWDNETWGTSRRGLSFVERRGTELVSARRACAEIVAAMCDVTKNLAEQSPSQQNRELAAAVSVARARAEDWSWLVHVETARTINTELAALRQKLTRAAAEGASGIYVPHCRETLALRQARLGSAPDIVAFLQAVDTDPAAPVADTVRSLVRRESPSATRPWKAGYDRALEVREKLGWGDDPIPDLKRWLTSNHFELATVSLPSSIDALFSRTLSECAVASVNQRGGSKLRRETAFAAALGHFLMDVDEIAVDGISEHWPTAARARAFAVMLLLPEDGLRAALAGQAGVGARDVKRLMSRFHAGPYATTFHLRNLGFISSERQAEILAELAA